MPAETETDREKPSRFRRLWGTPHVPLFLGTTLLALFIIAATLSSHLPVVGRGKWISRVHPPSALQQEVLIAPSSIDLVVLEEIGILEALLDSLKEKGEQKYHRWTAQKHLMDAFPNLPDPMRTNLKALAIKLRMARCNDVMVDQYTKLVHSALDKNAEIDYVKISADDIECDDPLPTTSLFHDQQEMPKTEPFVIYRDDEPELHPTLKNVIRDEVWYQKMKGRYTKTRDMLASNFKNLPPINERNIVPFTLAIPVLMADLRHTHLPLSSLYVQTELPAETVFAITQFDIAKQTPLLRSFVDLLNEMFSEIPGKKIIVQPELAWCGWAREMAINISRMPFFTAFDGDDFMHPLWFETHHRIFLNTPNIDAIMVIPRTLGSKRCDLQKNHELINIFFDNTSWDIAASRAGQKLKPYRTPKVVLEEARKYPSEWYFGNTEAEPFNLPKSPSMLDYWFPVHNGWPTARRVVYETTGITRDVRRGEDVRFEYRAVMAGFEFAHYAEIPLGIYMYRSGHTKCLEKDDLEEGRERYVPKDPKDDGDAIKMKIRKK